MSDKPIFIKPPNTLKEKVGDGGLPPYLLKQCQEFLENNSIDFIPFARRFQEDLNQIKNDIESGRAPRDESTIRKIAAIVMQLKANGSMFHYQIISMISEVMLRFMDKAQKIDADFMDIFMVYYNVLSAVINKQLRGNGGKEGQILTQELHSACIRYFTKNGIAI